MPSNDPIATIAKVIFGISVGAVMFNAFVVPRVAPWWDANWPYVIATTVGISIFGGYVYFKWRRGGTSTYQSHSLSHATPSTIATETISTESLHDSVIDSITSFRPIKKYKSEDNYKIALATHLKSDFTSTEVEVQKEHSRPDIAIDDIAIEVKGPTRHKDLRTIADKLMRYSQHFSGGIVVVLFDVNVNDGLYDEWYAGLKRQWPHVKVIRID